MITHQELCESGQIHGSAYDRRKRAWQPIETAPKNLPPFQRIVLARFIWLDESEQWHKSWQQVAHWFSPTLKWVMDSDGLAGASGGSCVLALRDDATHWMPLSQVPL
jgi:hypothetical protein